MSVSTRYTQASPTPSTPSRIPRWMASSLTPASTPPATPRNSWLASLIPSGSRPSRTSYRSAIPTPAGMPKWPLTRPDSVIGFRGPTDLSPFTSAGTLRASFPCKEKESQKCSGQKAPKFLLLSSAHPLPTTMDKGSSSKTFTLAQNFFLCAFVRYVESQGADLVNWDDCAVEFNSKYRTEWKAERLCEQFGFLKAENNEAWRQAFEEDLGSEWGQMFFYAGLGVTKMG